MDGKNKFVKIAIILLLLAIIGEVLFILFFIKNKESGKIDKPNNNEELDSFVEEEKKDPFVLELENQKYYIKDNLERYIAYKKEDMTASQIVSEVNCNLDKEYFVDAKKADLSKGNLILVNKYYYVDETFEPKNLTVLTKNVYTYWDNARLTKEVHDAFVKMVDDAKALGYSLIDTSPYRTYKYQKQLFDRNIKEKGEEWTLKSSAKPGFSEHHTGLATDIVKVGVSLYSFKDTSEFKWIEANAHKYGFILRYPEGKEHLTGYKYEPWHYRYVGVDVATYIYENDIVFEEYYAYFCEYKKEC